MAGPEPQTARSIAAKVLCEAQRSRQFAGEILEKYPQMTERQRATDLVFGVIRNHSAIDLVIEKVSSRLVERIAGKILNVIRVGVYELIYCPQTAEHAIVDEAVEYVKHVTNTRQADFVNAVLRQTQRHINNRRISLEEAHPQKTIPQTPNTGCEFDIDILPADESTQKYLSIAFSLPDWLVAGWLAEYGEKQTRAICFASNRRPGVYLRPNPLKTTAAELAEKLRTSDVECEIEPESQMIKLTSPKAITALPGFDEGLFAVQDLAASQPVRLLQPPSGWTILDLCAAPGTKTTQLAEATGGLAKIIATDIDAGRLKMVRENVARLGLAACVTVIDYHAVDDCAKRLGGFDCVLIDAPCSNTGVLARRPEVRHRITQKTIEDLTKVQSDLLSQAGKILKPQGIICYSTCSIQQDENNLLVGRFLAENTSYRIKLEKLTLPSAEGFDHDGGYAAIITNQADAT
jgi:16S rRNA (cytosine967-C5)-methyltransferase